MLEAINYIRNISKKKVAIDKIVPYLISSSFSSKLDSLEAKLCTKIIAMKLFFMDELHTIKNESLKSAKI